MIQKTALVIGASGLVGSNLIQMLIQDEKFSEIRIFGRRPTGQKHAKLHEHIIDFDKPEEWRGLVKGDVLFSALGTTMKKAGSRQAQFLIDHTYQYQFAKAASDHGVPVYVLVSSYMANEHSRIFYTRMKGELERDIKKLPFRSIQILQPGVLVGERKEKRFGEKLGISFLRFLNRLGIAKKQKPVEAGIVARAMINVSLAKEAGIQTYSLLDVFRASDLPE